MTHLSVVVGGQYGSEAKGHVTARVVEDALAADIDRQGVAVVRVAGPNAGHTAYDREGRSFAFRQMPVGVVKSRPEYSTITAIIAAGSEIDPDVLLDEIHASNQAGFQFQLLIDQEATLIYDQDKIVESHPVDSADHGTLVERIGSTGKGIGAARAGRLMRQEDRRLIDRPTIAAVFADIDNVFVLDTATALRALQPHSVVIEGTQGYGLGLHAGHYPQCTSSNCRASDFLAMTGINPWESWIETFEVWVTARVYPIRVAGNSGPLKDETTWEALGLPEERTTVTKKVRRVGGEDWDLVREAVIGNGGAPFVRLALTMVDQKYPMVKDQDFINVHDHQDMLSWMLDIEQEVNAKIGMVTTGPKTGVWMPASDRQRAW